MMQSIEVKFFAPDSQEWQAMWAKMADLGFAIDEEDAESGERWQYMGSVYDRYNRPDVLLYRHEFRHRSLKGERVYVHMPVLKGIRGAPLFGTPVIKYP